MYWLLWGLLTVGTVYEIYFVYQRDTSAVPAVISGKKQKIVLSCFISLVVMMTLMAALRYGQGSDYFGYERIYGVDKWSHYWLTPIEPAYRALSFGMHKLGMPYEMLVALISVFEMFCFWRFIQKYSPYKVMSLLLMYPTLYLTYIFSAYRQAIAISICLGFLVPLLQEKKWIKFVAGTIIAACFHKTAVLFLVLPILVRFKYKQLCKLLIVTVVGGILLCFIDISVPLKLLLQDRAAFYMDKWGSIDISIMGITERTLMMLFILWGSWDVVKEESGDTVKLLLCKIYAVGYMASGFFVRYSLMSSRLGAYFKAVEIVLIPILLSHMKPKVRKIVAAVLLLYVFIFLCKNIASYIWQASSRYVDTNIWNYPYISIFSKQMLE